MKEIEVKFDDVVVGHTSDGCKTIKFLDNENAKKVMKFINQSTPIYVSSRQSGILEGKGITSLSEIEQFEIL